MCQQIIEKLKFQKILIIFLTIVHTFFTISFCMIYVHQCKVNCKKYCNQYFVPFGSFSNALCSSILDTMIRPCSVRNFISAFFCVYVMCEIFVKTSSCSSLIGGFSQLFWVFTAARIFFVNLLHGNQITSLNRFKSSQQFVSFLDWEPLPFPSFFIFIFIG